MPDHERHDIHDNLKLALDELDTGPLDFIGLRNCVRYQREALQIAHRRLEAMRKEPARETGMVYLTACISEPELQRTQSRACFI